MPRATHHTDNLDYLDQTLETQLPEERKKVQRSGHLYPKDSGAAAMSGEEFRSHVLLSRLAVCRKGAAGENVAVQEAWYDGKIVRAKLRKMRGD